MEKILFITTSVMSEGTAETLRQTFPHATLVPHREWTSAVNPAD